MSRRLFQIVVAIILAAATLTPLLEAFDRWDKNPGPDSDTEIHVTAWFVGLGVALVVARALRYVPTPAKIGRQARESQVCTALIAQSSRVTGELTGTISDNTGAVVPQAAVIATDAATNQQRTAVSDDAGRFVFHGLHDGIYSVRVHRDGFADTVRPTVTVTIGGVAQLDVTLKPASSTQEVTINADASILEPQRTSIATVIDKERIEESPVQSRNFLNFILLAPGVSASNAASSQSTPSLSGSGFSFGGLRPRSNAIFIDGASNNDEFTGSNRTEISLEDVQEFQVVNHGFAAESGGAAKP